MRRAAGGSGLGLWGPDVTPGSLSSSSGSLHSAVQRYAAGLCREAARAHAQAARHSPASARAWNGLGVCATALGTPGLAQHALLRRCGRSTMGGGKTGS